MSQMHDKVKVSPVRKCAGCGHTAPSHMHNLTGEMFGSVLAWCAFCPCKAWQEPSRPATEDCEHKD